MTDPATTITCPVCDAPNTSRSLFCAECGTPLRSEDDDAVTTRTGASSVSSQSTAVIPTSRVWSHAVESQPPHDAAKSTGGAPIDSVSAEHSHSPLHSPVQRVESRRGFWLGLVAVIIILIVLGMWIWGGVLAADTRSSVRGIFG